MNKVKSKAVKTKIKKTEKIKRKLAKESLLREDLKIAKDEKHSFIPILDKHITCKENDFEIVEKKFEKNEEKIDSYKKLVKVPKKFRKNLPTSYDIIGDIALIKIDQSLEKYNSLVGNAILKANKNIKTVCNKKPVSGELRTREIEVIAGEKKTETIHKEFGLKFFVDIEKVYFSPRLANERKRVSELVKKGEVIVDMFCGVGPFPIVIKKFSNPKIIFAVDKNKKAIELAKRNIRLNKMIEYIKPINEDAKNIEKIIPKDTEINRAIMNLPFSSDKFLRYVFELIKSKCTIHYYEILSKNEIKKRILELRKQFEDNNLLVENIKLNIIKSYTPREFYICFDITAKRNHMPM